MISYFSVITVKELLDSNCLSEKQICREYERFAKLTNYDVTHEPQPTILDKIRFIKDKVNFFVGFSDTDKTVDSSPSSDIATLCTPATNFSNLKGINKPLELFQNARNDEIEHLASNPNIPYLRYTNSDFSNKPDLLKSLNDNVDFNYKLNGRDIAYYGDYDYRYTGAKHKSRPISDCSVLNDISKEISSLFPTFNFNSVLVTRYPDGKSKCPAHSDDEQDIVSDSLIVSLSFGSGRVMNVRRKMEFVVDSFTLNAGDILIMSKVSQGNYDHGIPETSDDVDERISLTFRLIKPARVSDLRTSNMNSPRAPLLEAHHSPKKVLILSDSRNLSFDTSDFKSQSVVCFKEPCYTLDSISQHENKIAQADVVLISTGINDIIRERGDALQLFDYLRNLMESYYNKYPSKIFIFYAVSDVSGKFIDFNPVIDQFNDYCFEMSLRLSNFKLFNNLFFDTNRHLASDGLHLSKYGKWSASVIWTQSAEIVLGIRSAKLPLRPRYLERLNEFQYVSFAWQSG